jgi:hypothetical protein
MIAMFSTKFSTKSATPRYMYVPSFAGPVVFVRRLELENKVKGLFPLVR